MGRRKIIEPEGLLQDVLAIIQSDVTSIKQVAKLLTAGEVRTPLPEETALTLVRYAQVLGKIKSQQDEDDEEKKKQLSTMTDDELRKLSEKLGGTSSEKGDKR